MPRKQQTVARAVAEVIGGTTRRSRLAALEVVGGGGPKDRAAVTEMPPVIVVPDPWPPCKILQSSNPTPQRILEVSLERFANRGYLDTSLQDIADEVGILKGSLYHYIRGKRDLLSAIFSLEHERQRLFAIEINERSLVGLDAVSNFMRGLLESVLRDARGSRVTERDWESLTPEERDALLDLTMRYLHYLKQNIQIAQDRGQITPTHNPGVVATAIFGMIEWPQSWFRPDTRLNGQILADSFVHLIFDGLRIR